MPAAPPRPRPALAIAGECVGPRPTTSDRVSQLYRAHATMVFRLALRYGGDRSWAEDITHEVFVQAIANLDKLDAVDNLGGWFYTVTTRRCLNRLRWQQVRTSAAVRWAIEQRVPCPASPEELGVHRERLARVFQVVSKLPPKMRVCFWMVHVDGKDQQEVAKILGHSKGYVSKLIKRATQALERSERDA